VPGAPPTIVRIDSTWDGRRAPEDQIATIALGMRRDSLEIRVSSPFHGDPLPPSPAGPTENLWEYEVVEVFLAGPGGYLEVELGPNGHYLVLEFSAPRVVERRLIPIGFSADRLGPARWAGTAAIPRALLPVGLDRVNAYRIYGTGPSRRYLAAFPVGGDKPDFHRLERFGPLEASSL
jgi:hypothetical protein